MNIGVHGKKFLKDNKDLIQSILENVSARNCKLYYSDSYAPSLQKFGLIDGSSMIYKEDEDLSFLDMIITLGGDGTLLEAVAQTGPLRTPILGINTGRMGFLATTAKETVMKSIDDLFEGKYTYDERTLLKLEAESPLFGDKNFALNDFTILKKDTSSMILVNAYVDGEFLNGYWADGLIVSTPTGSTGYSLSCGGPLILPGSSNFVITPVSPHNLTTRPMVVPDHSKLTFTVEGRSKHFLTSLDSRFKTIGLKTELNIEKADFKARLIKLEESSYFKTIRNKLSWGVDVRN